MERRTILLILILMTGIAHGQDNQTNLTINETKDKSDEVFTLSEMISEIESDMSKINKKINLLKKFKVHSEEIEEQLALLEKKQHIKSLNRTELEDLIIGYVLSTQELRGKIKEKDDDCKVKLKRLEAGLEKEIDVYREKNNMLETIIGVIILFYFITLIVYNRHRIFGRKT